eukprot:m.847771 g.847771  ORF g.847771 m.847771 type:complete len:614 (-) comp23486_c0_seq5:2231-4072(-)
MPSAGEQDSIVDTAAEVQHRIDGLSLLLFVILLIFTTLLIWMFKSRSIRGLHETGVSMIMGAIAGFLIDRSEINDSHNVQLCNLTEQQQSGLKTVEQEAQFDSETFFFVLLPPIIFFAGYDLKQKHFFRNIASVLVYAFLGTTIACGVTGGMIYLYSKFFMKGFFMPLVECMLFGAIISATDPVTVLAIYHDLHVDHNLYALVFGESVLNDAVSLVLASTMEKFEGVDADKFSAMSVLHAILIFIIIFTGSFAVGCLTGMVTALLMKFTSVQRLPMVEMALFVLVSYMTFLIGEVAELSGIVAVLFCGITQAHYTYPNLSEHSKKNSKDFFGLINFLAENFIFSYIGLSFFTFKCHEWDVGFILWSIFTILFARVVMIYPLSWMINKCRRKGQAAIPMSFQHCLWFAGLRGAIAFALAMRNTSTVGRRMILSTTLVIVLSTVVIFGGGTMSVLQKLKIRVGVKDDDEPSTSGTPIALPAVSSSQQKSKLAKFWQGFDKKYLKPVFTVTPEGKGTDTWRAVQHTLYQYWKGEKETYLDPRDDDAFNSSDDEGDSDADSAASSELVNFDDDDDDADAMSGDIGRSSTVPSETRMQTSAVFKGFTPMRGETGSKTH